MRSLLSFLCIAATNQFSPILRLCSIRLGKLPVAGNPQHPEVLEPYVAKSLDKERNPRAALFGTLLLRLLTLAKRINGWKPMLDVAFQKKCQPDIVFTGDSIRGVLP
jgi:hypothetical protein